jgi:phosphoribosyl 1,2-cyclic phosphodiesterase/CheY-like chemotaxis protein
MQWQVFEAVDGQSGLALALKHPPDIILCDLLMPRGNGFQLCRAVREHLELRHTRIIICSGRDFSHDRITAEEAGADLYLLKPLLISRLREAIDEVMALQTTIEIDNPPTELLFNSEDLTTRIKFWGVRGSVPTPGASTVFFGGNTSCVEVRSAGEIIVLDAGSGIRPLGLELAREFKGQPINLTLLISHTHWDHIQGFPFFLPAYDAKNRVHVLGYEGARDGLRATLAGQMESPYFPIALSQMPGNIVIEELKEMEFSVGEIPVRACFTNHPGVCVGYRIFTRAGSVVYIPDNETFAKEGGKSGNSAIPSSLDHDIIEFVRDAEILIADSQYDLAEYGSHVGWGHGCLDEVVRMAITANVKRLFLFHHDPAHDDRFISSMLMNARAIAQAAGSSIRIDASREGEEIILTVPVAVPSGHSSSAV